MIRHGDVVLIKAKIPKRAKSLGQRKELAYGEVTGHAHRLDVGEMFETKEGMLFCRVGKAANLSHEEHKNVVIEPGEYKVVIKRQYEPNGWRKVAD